MRVLLLYGLLMLALPGNLLAQTREAEPFIREGNDYYQQQQYEKAAAAYRKALDKDPQNLVARFNQANAVFRQDQKVEAAKLFAGVIQQATTKDLLAKSHYNKGVVLTREKNLEESIESYKNALRNDPSDKEARENLQKALLELKKKQPPPKEQEQKKKKDQKQQQQKNQPQSKLSPRDADQRLQLLQQKEKEVQQRMQQEKSKMGGSKAKDW